LRAGIHDFIQKPFKAKMISDALERMTAGPGAHAGDVSLCADGDVDDTQDDRWREDLEFTIQKVTHQVNNAFAALSGKAELGMRKAPVNGGVKKFSDILGIPGSVVALNKELMSFGKALSRRPFKPVDVIELIRLRTLAHADMCHEKGARLCVQNASQGPFLASTCEEPLVHILDNILINAVQGVAGVRERTQKITVSVGQAAAKIVVQVQDNGVGMSPETLEKACANGFTTKPHGNGLGLFITNRLCQVIKASMRMDSLIGQGTTVTLVLPRHDGIGANGD
jgi:signal transduction histidine kinase